MTVLTHVPRGTPARAGRPQERAATLVEVALTLPILILSILGFVDLGMAVFQSSQASSAAADGARVGIIRFEGADVAGSADRAAIEAAVTAKLVGQKIESVAVACIDPASATVSCAAADPEVDRLRVTVTWTFRPISPMGHAIPSKVLTGRATMGLIDQPQGMTTTTTTPATTTTTTTPSSTTTTSTTTPTTTTTLPPEGCVITSLVSAPATTDVKNSGALENDLALTLNTNGNVACTLLTVRITTNGATEEVVAFNKVTATKWTATVDKNGFKWTPGVKVGTAYSGPTSLSAHPLVTLT
ncbi:TadE/TadG family type IV pilus assembly protein [Aquihabitans daechungensis]|uniref:TadE/TadG family type IV pilus assembly protein n=1 Tax=Aquihabitans daechungensis TaxID=1052257 RepID=UPI003BA00D8B